MNRQGPPAQSQGGWGRLQTESHKRRQEEQGQEEQGQEEQGQEEQGQEEQGQEEQGQEEQGQEEQGQEFTESKEFLGGSVYQNF